MKQYDLVGNVLVLHRNTTYDRNEKIWEEEFVPDF